MASPAARKRVLKASSSNLMGRGAAAASVALLAAFVFATSAANAAAASKTSSSPSQPLLLSTPSGEPSSPLTLEIPGLVSGGLKTKPSTGGRVLAAKRSFASSWKRNGGGDGGAQLDTSSTSSTSTSSSSSSSSSSAAAAAAALPPCSALVTVSPAWTTLASGDPAVSLAVTVTNDGAAAVPTPWEVKLVSEGSSGPDSSSSPSYSSVLQAWNLEKTALVSASSNNGSSSQAISGQAPGYWQAIPPHGGQASFGMILELSKETGASLLNSLASSAAASETGSASASASSLLMGAPTSLELNGRACALETEVAEALEAPPALELPLEGVPAASNETTTTSTPAPTSTPPPANVSSAFSPGSGDASITPGRMTTLDGKIIGVDGKPVYLMGLNWFGFDAGATMTDGLWGGRDATAQDFANVVYRIKLLGFNAIRLPFSFRDLYEKTPKWLNTKCTYVPPEAVAAQTRPSTVSAAAAGNPPPPGDAFAVSTPQGTCNSYMPQQNTFDRFLWTVDYLARNGFYVMLDNQFNLDQTATQQPQLWVQRWTDLATKLTQRYPLAASMSMIDIINEPDAWGVGWTPQNGKPGYGDMSLKIMDALYKVNPGFLYVLEGCGQANLAKNWGDGMAVDPELVKSRGLTDPNPFFRTLMTRPYLSQVIAGPHVYSPSVSSAQDSTEGPALYKRLSQSFGYLNKQGYCLDGSNAVGKPSGNCHVFPVVIGETGTGFVDRRDLQPQLDLAAWAVAKPGSGVPADDGLHNPVQGFFWWAWNANGDGQMGIVQNDWTTVDWNKVRYLESVGLKPWYKNNGTAPPPPPPPSPPPPPPPPTTTTPPPPTKPPTPPPTTKPPVPTTTPPQTWPVAPMITPLQPVETRRGRRSPPAAAGSAASAGDNGGGILGSDVFFSDDATSSSAATPLQAPLPTPPAVAAGGDEAAADNNNAVEVAVDESVVAAPAPPNAPFVPDPSISTPPPPVSLAAMVGELFSWAYEAASPPLQPGGSTGEASASSESFGLDSRPLAARGTLLLGSDGAPFDLRAVSWPGFDAAETGGWLRGLEGGGPSATTADADARTQFSRMRALGFSAVKFPFSMPVVLGNTKAELASAAASSSSAAPEVECSVTPEEEVKTATTPADSPPTAWNHWPEGAELPTGSSGSSSKNTKCNAGVPAFSSKAPPLARLSWAAARAAEAGLYVILEDAGTTAREDPAAWVDGWARVAASVANAPVSAEGSGAMTVGGRLALRLLADPDALSLSWATPGDDGGSNSKNSTSAPSLRRLALTAMDSLSRVAPSALLLVPGGGQTALFGGGGGKEGEGATAVLSGAGFATDLAALSAAGIDALASADGFLTELVGTRGSYLDRVVLSPTLGVSSANGEKGELKFPSSQRLWKALDASFGTLTSVGHCLNGASSCHRFAVVVGGLGGETWASDGAAKLREDVSAWLQPTCGLPLCASAAAPGGGRPGVRSWSWGEWKASDSSQSPSSILLSPAAGSSTPLVHWEVVDWLTKGLGLLPWTAPPSTAWREGPGPEPTEVLQAAGNPSSSGTVSTESERPPPAAAGCAALYFVDASGAAKASNSSTAVASVVLTLANLGRSAAISPPFVVSMSRREHGGYSSVLQAHGVAPGSAHVVSGGSSRNSEVRARVSDLWSVLWPSAGSSVSLSLVVSGGNGNAASASASASAASSSSSSSSSLAPTEVSINGVPCSVSKAPDSTASAEGEGYGTRSVMQTARGFPLQAV